jgi:hypothetical protein
MLLSSFIHGHQGRLDLEENTFSIESQLYWIVDSSAGIYTVSRNGKLGLVNHKAQLITEAQYDVIEPFSQEATVMTSKGKYGILNREGDVIVPCEYEIIKPFASNVTAFKEEHRWGIIDAAGNIIEAPEYYQLSAFHDGMALAMTPNADYLLVDATGNTTYLFHRDKSGIPYAMKNELYDILNRYYLDNYPGALYYYQDGMAKGVNLKTFKYCFVDKAGNQLFDKDFEFILPFDGKYAPVKTDKGWNYIDRNGTYKSKTWHPVLNIKGDLIFTEKKDKFGIVDTADNILVPFKYESIIPLTDSLFAACYQKRFSPSAKWGVINLKNEVVLDFIYEGINFDPTTGIGKAGVYDHSTSLNTGIPRYYYFGHYFLFDQTGIIIDKPYSYSMLVEMVGDWHSENINLSHSLSQFAPPLDLHEYGLTVSAAWSETTLLVAPSGGKKTLTVTNTNGKTILSGNYFSAKVYLNCIVVRSSEHSIIYDHFGNRLFKTKNAILDGYDNGTFRMYTGSGSGNESIDALGNITD